MVRGELGRGLYRFMVSPFRFLEGPAWPTRSLQACLNLFIAACLGASIGLERQWRQHLAGLRTNTLVALGAAIFITYARAVCGP